MLQQKQYVPILKSGIAEVGAFRSLYPSVKENVFPLFLARPWPNASRFTLTIDRLCEATDGRPFGFGLDQERFQHQSHRDAQAEFNALFDERGGFRSYFDLVEAIPQAVPTILPTRSADTLLLQLANAERIDRGVIVHQRRGSAIPLSDLVTSSPPLPDDAVIIIDAGWSRDYTALEAWTLPTVERVLRSLPDTELVIACSSFPNSFAHIVGHLEEQGTERRLFSVVRQRFNQADLTYGDWGSTRPSSGGGGGTIPSRIDVPKISSWEIFRADPDNDLGFCEMAWDAQHHPCFPTVPDCWGKETIGITTDDGVGITGRQVATEVRVNIHMTVQSGADSIAPSDEIPYED